MSSPKLSDTSYAVLGMLEFFQPATPYQLKQVAQESLFHFWTIPHTQIYTECARLAEAGLLKEEREQAGRRRRVYRLAKAGREALREWRADPDAGLYELRDPALLKLFCGADRAPLAEAQLELHRRRLAAYEEVCEQPGLPEGVRLTLEAGIGHQREYIRFWSRLLDQTSSKSFSRKVSETPTASAAAKPR